MPNTSSAAAHGSRVGTSSSSQGVHRVPVLALGVGLSALFAITFVLCVLFDLWFPPAAMNPVWAPLFPGFTWISWPSFFLGFVEAVGYGWYVALIFGPIYNFFAAKAS